MKPIFESSSENDFYKVAKERVNEYFKIKGKSKHADKRMWIKTAVFFFFYFICYGAILSGQFKGFSLIGWYTALGVMMSFFGLNLSHDLMHGAFFSKPQWNKIGSYFFDLNGTSSYIWKVSHNIHHHTYTNIPGHDQDINKAILLRLSPADKLYPFHRYQHLYAFFLYLFTSLNWMAYADFQWFFRQRKEVTTKDFILFFLFKIIYLFLFLILPILIVPVPAWQIFLGFLCLHFAGGSMSAIVFQLAHIVEHVEFPECIEGRIQDPWAVHELKTTSNFAPESKILNYLVGGLNCQIEHHLFAHICHVHYPDLSSILRKTAEEFGLPYISQPSFFSAIRSHFRMLKKLGTEDISKA